MHTYIVAIVENIQRCTNKAEVSAKKTLEELGCWCITILVLLANGDANNHTSWECRSDDDE